MMLRNIERILRNSCAGRLEDDYAKLTAKTAMKLADAIFEQDMLRSNGCKCPCHDPLSPPVIHEKPCCADLRTSQAAGSQVAK